MLSSLWSIPWLLIITSLISNLPFHTEKGTFTSEVSGLVTVMGTVTSSGEQSACRIWNETTWSVENWMIQDQLDNLGNSGSVHCKPHNMRTLSSFQTPGKGVEEHLDGFLLCLCPRLHMLSKKVGSHSADWGILNPSQSLLWMYIWHLTSWFCLSTGFFLFTRSILTHKVWGFNGSLR